MSSTQRTSGFITIITKTLTEYNEEKYIYELRPT